MLGCFVLPADKRVATAHRRFPPNRNLDGQSTGVNWAFVDGKDVTELVSLGSKRNRV